MSGFCWSSRVTCNEHQEQCGTSVNGLASPIYYLQVPKYRRFDRPWSHGGFGICTSSSVDRHGLNRIIRTRHCRLRRPISTSAQCRSWWLACPTANLLQRGEIGIGTASCRHWRSMTSNLQYPCSGPTTNACLFLWHIYISRSTIDITPQRQGRNFISGYLLTLWLSVWLKAWPSTFVCTPSLCVPNTKSGSRTFTRTPLIDMIIEICCWGGKEENTRSESVFITSFICVLRVQTRRRHSAITGTIYASESHKPQPELNADTLIATRRLVTRITIPRFRLPRMFVDVFTSSCHFHFHCGRSRTSFLD